MVACIVNIEGFNYVFVVIIYELMGRVLYSGAGKTGAFESRLSYNVAQEAG